MMSSISSPNSFDAFESDDELQWDVLPVDSVALSTEQMIQAAQFAQAVGFNGESDRQWRTYLLSLALSGFTTWLGDRSPALGADLSRLDREGLQQGLRSSSHADVITHLQIGGFRVCLVAMGSLIDETVALPISVLREADSAAHFYVLVEVLEEQQQARIHGYFRHDQWQVMQADDSSQSVVVDEELGQCSVPLTQFVADGDRLLLDLRVLSPAAIPLPQGAQVEVEPENVSEISATTSSAAIATVDRLLDQLQAVANRALNAATWVHDQLDEVAADLSWSLTPELVTGTTGLRSGAIANGDFVTEAAIANVFQDLQSSGQEMPMSVRGAYRDLRWGKAGVRLHALVWDMPDAESEPEWTLLLVLSALPNHTLPSGLTLIVRDEQDILAERGVWDEDDDSSLYAQVIGSQQEMFWVTIDFGNGAIATLPPFAFQP